MYDLCLFFAERVNGHKGSALAGTVLVVAKKLTPAMQNGETFAAVAVPKGEPNGVPCRTWIHPSHVTKRCVQVTEAEARAIQPSMFASLERFDRSPEFRAMHALEIARAYADGRYTMQPADEAVLAILCPSKPEETAEGFTHR
jgi:hypothetical protein